MQLPFYGSSNRTTSLSAEPKQITVRSLALFCSRVGSISLSENFFTQSHSWAQSYHSEYFPPPSHFWPFLAISRLFKAIQGYFRQFQDITSYSTLFQSISTYVSLFGPITFYLLLVVALRLWSFVFRRLLHLGAKGLLQTYSVIRKEISTPKMRRNGAFHRIVLTSGLEIEFYPIWTLRWFSSVVWITP